MMSATIERLIIMYGMNAPEITPQVTGPGACKVGIMSHIGGNGYPQRGKYKGCSNRNITMIGTGLTAKRKTYIKRSAIASGEDQAEMNQTHYASKEAKNGLASHSCLMEINRTIYR